VSNGVAQVRQPHLGDLRSRRHVCRAPAAAGNRGLDPPRRRAGGAASALRYRPEKAHKSLPDDAPVMIANREMAKAFAALAVAARVAAAERLRPPSGWGGAILIILTDEKGISPADENVYRKLVDKLNQDTRTKLPYRTSSLRRNCAKS